ncbi:glycosyltransferase family 4 protein [Cellulophaga sp. HaHaR_3_176]|uniref:glycosyltransferase family 4 protein n=1 Tax=Cellulophaga sp. HaHaR_3_176 TaxID=1942464 RepID=UPI001C1FAF3B|nr:glycosyltransferase family 4 protein [Cellulophaga sp. HaHaR_3_176]QWX84796.1 glycosyltransferase family 4 protein [Cellulophaga sp. HaHaR_3_176]
MLDVKLIKNEKMKCLHICNDFSLTKVHSNLYKNLDQLNVEQIIYNPTRNTTPIGNNIFEFKVHNSKVVYSKTLKVYHKVFFNSKIKFLEKNLLENENLSDVNLIHATTLFSDGALAYKLHQKKSIPYIVAVRATDLTVFLKYRKDLYSLGLQIINNASKLIFISDSLKNKFLNHPFLSNKKDEIEKKCIVIYNGIDDFWLNKTQLKKYNNKPQNILYVGRLIPRKKIINLATAILELKNEGINFKLNIIGSGGADEEKLKEISNNNPDTVKCLGSINNKEELLKNYSNNDIFAMPSIGETFGLVYIEALSQGLPLLYSKADGIDGVFDINIGESCNGNDVLSIKNNLKKLFSNYSTYELHKIDFIEFNWKHIAQKYLNLYQSI